MAGVILRPSEEGTAVVLLNDMMSVKLPSKELCQYSSAAVSIGQKRFFCK